LRPRGSGNRRPRREGGRAPSPVARRHPQGRRGGRDLGGLRDDRQAIRHRHGTAHPSFGPAGQRSIPGQSLISRWVLTFGLFRTAHLITNHLVEALWQLLDLAGLTTFGNRRRVSHPCSALEDESVLRLILQDDERLSIYDRCSSLC